MVKRDMELIRRILVDVQSRKDMKPRTITFDDVEPVVMARHLEILIDAGFVDHWPHREGRSPIPEYLVKDLSWEGHDFVAALENEGVWAKIKSTLTPSELSTIPIALVKEIGVRILKQYLFNRFGFGGD